MWSVPEGLESPAVKREPAHGVPHRLKTSAVEREPAHGVPQRLKTSAVEREQRIHTNLNQTGVNHMKINPNNVDILISAVSKEQYPETGLKEIALSGRSNVGKSSFINTIVGRKNLARTSSKPGKTQTLNFFNVDEKFIFVDVPGYGYAQQSKQAREKWGKFIEQYLSERQELAGVIQLIDLRHKPTEDDVLMYNYLKHFDLPVIVICTKMDKIPKSKVDKHIKIIKQHLEFDPGDTIIPFSSVDKINVDAVLSALESLINDTQI